MKSFIASLSKQRVLAAEVERLSSLPTAPDYKEKLVRAATDKRNAQMPTNTILQHTIKKALTRISTQAQPKKAITPQDLILNAWRKFSLTFQMGIQLFAYLLTVAGFIIVLATMNLFWLRGQLVDSGEKFIVESVDEQMIDYAAQGANEYMQKLQRTSTFLNEYGAHVNQIFEADLTNEVFSQPLYWNYEIPHEFLDYAPAFPNHPVTYEFAAIYSPNHELSEAGIEIIKSLKAINALIPKLYQEQFMYMAIAFPYDDLYMYYPALPWSGEYYAEKRAWYKGAVKRNGDIKITEPYQDAFTGSWLVTTSKALFKPNGELRGVIAVDFYLEFLFEGISEVRILDSGFAAMISNGGAVVSYTHLWETDLEVYRVFGEHRQGVITGIDLETWVEIRDEDRDLDETWDYDDPNTKSTSHLVRNYVRDPLGSIMYTIIVVANYDEIVEIVDGLEDRLDDMSVIVFWMTLSLSIFMLLLYSVLLGVWICYFNSKFSMIKQTASDVMLYAAHPVLITQENIDAINIIKYDEKDSLQRILYKFQEKLVQIKETDDTYTKRNKVWSRPQDKFLYTDWQDLSYSKSTMRIQNYTESALREAFKFQRLPDKD